MSGQMELRDPQHLSLPFAPESVGVARHALDSWLTGAATDTEFLEDCRLVVSELVGNAVRHAHPLIGGTMDVDWGCDDGELRIAVTDGGSTTTPRRVNAEPSDVSGRGLAIVEALSARWWIESDTDTTTVNALINLT